MPDIKALHPEGEKLIHINQNVAVGTLNSDEVANAEELRTVQVSWKTKGVNTTGKLQGTHLDAPAAGDWFDLQTLIIGLNSAVNVVCKRIRVQLSQSIAAENNELTVFGIK